MEVRQLGRYVLEGVLGKGAMGVVYLARDPVIGRRLALKTLTVPQETEEAEEFRQRFLREAQAAGILNHPGIVTVHDAGVDEASGLSYIAMEYIEGKSLKDALRGGHMFAFSEVARIGAALAGALDYAHSKGVVHRDIKPANIILTPQGQVKITDFGVARMESSNLTATGQFIGTPNYMSPEQVTGSAIDGRSDLFSLGVVLFELMTGSRPFVGASLTEVGYKIVHEPPPIPSQIRAGLPPAFNPIVLKLLEKQADKRYQKGADVARALDALRRVLSGMTGEITAYATPPAGAAVDPAGVMQAAPTATRATQIQDVPREAAAAKAAPSWWRLPIQPRWVALCLAAAFLPPATLILVLAMKVDRGPYAGPPVGEPARRHAVGMAQRRAAEALAAGRPEEAERLLEEVWDQAPYSSRARALKHRAAALRGTLAGQQQRQAEAQRLLDEGKSLKDQGRWREAQDRFDRALVLLPDDPVLREWAEYVRERARSPRASRPEPVIAVRAAPTATPPATDGQARLELYFNSPLPAGSVEIEADGRQVSSKPFSFYQKGFMGLKKEGTGVVQDAYAVAAAARSLTVRLRAEDGRLLAEQSLPASFFNDGRFMLKIEMDGKQAVPRFTLTPMRAR